jgi:aldehyde:ferredoxin oxidoreductase
MSQYHGYAGRILRVDLSSQQTSIVPTASYSFFMGGRGMAARIHWDEVPSDVGALDPQNRLSFLTGPLVGFAGFASSRWQVCGKSPATVPEHFCYSNLGGTWGVALKFAGYDGVVVQGKADRPVYCLIQEAGAELKDAGHLWGRGAIEAREILKSELGASVNVVACGQAGENRAIMASLLADQDASGSSGFGAVMGSKNLKAIAVVKGGIRPVPADPYGLRDLIRRYNQLRGRWSDQLFPVAPGKSRRDSCWGCPGVCGRLAWKASNESQGKFFCQSALLYQIRAQQFYGHGREEDVPFAVTKLCDNYGVDTMAVHSIMSWLSRCHRDGLLSEVEGDLPLSKVGSLEYAEALLHKIAFREGFGDLLAQGIEKAADSIGRGAREKIGDLIHKAQQPDQYGPRTYPVNSLLYATEVRMPIQHLHKVCIPVLEWLGWAQGSKDAHVSDAVIRAMAARFLGSEMAADFSSHEGKALAARLIQDRQYAAECLILCDYGWPVMTSFFAEGHVGDPSLESSFLSAVTGEAVNEEGLLRIGEKVFNLQRAILAREGRGGRASDSLPEYCFTTPLKFDVLNPEMLVPGHDGQPTSRKGMTVDKAALEGIKTEYYRLRGWDPATGRQTAWKLADLGLTDIARDLETRGLLA